MIEAALVEGGGESFEVVFGDLVFMGVCRSWLGYCGTQTVSSVTIEGQNGSICFVFSFFGENLFTFARGDVDGGCFNGGRDFAGDGGMVCLCSMLKELDARCESSSS